MKRMDRREVSIRFLPALIEGRERGDAVRCETHLFASVPASEQVTALRATAAGDCFAEHFALALSALRFQREDTYDAAGSCHLWIRGVPRRALGAPEVTAHSGERGALERFLRGVCRRALPERGASSCGRAGRSGREVFLAALHLEDLALACALRNGSEPAWEHFVSEYRPILRAAARAIVGKGGEERARELADSLYAELYGLDRKGGERKASLLDYFHGRSKLSTWLRAVLAQRHVDGLRNLRRTQSVDDEAVRTRRGSSDGRGDRWTIGRPAKPRERTSKRGDGRGRLGSRTASAATGGSCCPSTRGFASGRPPAALALLRARTDPCPDCAHAGRARGYCVAAATEDPGRLAPAG